MPTAAQVLQRKGDAYVASLPPDATALVAAAMMNDRQIGSVLVVDRDRPVGIFTERDVLRRIVAAKRNPATTELRDVMTTPIAVAALHTRSDEIRHTMRERRIRHVPVVDDDHAVGMISIGDLNRVEQDIQERTIRYLEQYMSVA